MRQITAILIYGITIGAFVWMWNNTPKIEPPKGKTCVIGSYDTICLAEKKLDSFTPEQ